MEDPHRQQNEAEPIPAPKGEAEVHTGAALRRLSRAVGGDLAAFARRLPKLRRDRPERARRRPRPSWRIARALVILIGAVSLLGGAALAGVAFWALRDLPLDQSLHEGPPASSMLLEYSDGSPLGRIGPLKAAYAERNQFPDVLVKAVLSIEDRDFYSHPGVDISGVARALLQNAAAGDIVQGGSTITQQLVKNSIVGDERTFRRKLREAALAVWLEMHLSKDEILTRYLNTVYLGGGAYGMPAAARLYFDKNLADLTLPEAALLAGLIKAPSQYSPFRDLGAAQHRAAVVLEAMAETGAVDKAGADQARASPAVLHPAKVTTEANSWFADWVGQQASDLAASFRGTLRARTTLVPELQRDAEEAIRATLADKGAAHGVSQAALVAMRPDGSVVAMVGGRDYADSQFNRAAQAKRQPGSAFKLFTYYAALRAGYTPDSVIDASPVDINGWRPDNFGGEVLGRMPLNEAFYRSINTAAARLASTVGLGNVIQAARDLGITSPLAANPSIALGSSEVTLVELTSAYASVAAGKMPVQPWGISAFGAQGQQMRSVGAPIVDQKPVDHRDELVSLLRSVVEKGTGKGAALNGFAAGKTGTSQDFRDAWFIGFNESLVVGVWVGNDDRTPMDEITGGSLPALIWKTFMTKAPAVVASSAASAPPPATVQANFSPAPQPAATGPAGCDVAACSATYSSFRASDCTYQPYSGGARQICTKGQSTLTQAAPPPPPVSQADAGSRTPEQAGGAGPTSSACNVAVCSRFYSSFRASDCTYQPYDGGPRQLCMRSGSGGESEANSRPPVREAGQGGGRAPVPPQIMMQQGGPPIIIGRMPPGFD